MPKYYVHITVNSPRGEDELNMELTDLNEVMSYVHRIHPSATSVVLAIVPNEDGKTSFGEA